MPLTKRHLYKKIHHLPYQFRNYLCSLLKCHEKLRMNKPLIRKGKEFNSSFMSGFTESFLADIGQVIMAWSQVEEQFNLLYLSAIVMEDKGTGSMSNPRIVKMRYSFKNRVRIYRQYIRTLSLSDERKQEMLDTMTELKKCYNERNQLAHSQFSIRFDENKIDITQATKISTNWKNYKGTDFSTTSQEQIQQLFEKIHALFWNLHEIALHR